MSDRYEGYAYTVPGGISTEQAERVARKIAEVRRNARRRATVDKFFTRALYVVFIAAGVVGIILAFEMFSFLLRG